MPLFYDHQSDEEITIKRQTVELANWIEHFEFIAVEIHYLDSLKNVLKTNNELILELLSKKEENEYLLSLFYDFRNKSEDVIECLDIACDMYFTNQHEIYRNQYLAFIRSYRILKIEIIGKT